MLEYTIELTTYIPLSLPTIEKTPVVGILGLSHQVPETKRGPLREGS